MKTIKDINFAELYRNHIQLATRSPKLPQDWDQKAQRMQQSQFDLQQDYVEAFRSRMDLNPEYSLLDVGCGGGAIAISVAHLVKQVYALDYSQGMLDVLQQRCIERKIMNIQPILRAWEESWRDIPQCDICVSSRSSMVEDLEAALIKLNTKARKAVYMTMIVDKDFIHPDVLAYIGRDSIGFPNYIYAVNILYQQGYRAKVDFIDSPSAMVKVEQISLQGFIHSVQWSIGGQLSEIELHKLKDYYIQNSEYLQYRPAKRNWAFISWQKS